MTLRGTKGAGNECSMSKRGKTLPECGLSGEDFGSRKLPVSHYEECGEDLELLILVVVHQRGDHRSQTLSNPIISVRS